MIQNRVKVVFYRQWTMENGWTYPNDILIDPTGRGLAACRGGL